MSQFGFETTRFERVRANKYGSQNNVAVSMNNEHLRKVGGVENGSAKLSFDASTGIVSTPNNVRVDSKTKSSSDTRVLTQSDFDSSLNDDLVRANEHYYPLVRDRVTIAAGPLKSSSHEVRVADVSPALAHSPELVVLVESAGLFAYRVDGPETFTQVSKLASPSITWGFTDVDGVAVGDFNGNGYLDVALLASNDVYVYLNDESDGGATWPSETKLSATNNITGGLTGAVAIRAGDIDGDGKDELVVAFDETSGGTDDGGLIAYYLDGSDAWQQHQLITHDNILSLYRELMIDVTGDGNATDIVYGVSSSTAAPAGKGLFRITQPDNPLSETWTRSTIISDSVVDEPIAIARGNFFGNGTGRDFVLVNDAVSNSSDNIIRLDAGNSFSRQTLFFSRTFLGANVANLVNIAAVPSMAVNGFDGLFVAANDGAANSALLLFTYYNGQYNNHVYQTIAGNQNPILSYIVPYSFRNTDTDQLLVPVNDAAGLSWLDFTRTPLPETLGTRLELSANVTSLADGIPTALNWDTVQYDAFQANTGGGSDIILSPNTYAVRVLANVQFSGPSGTSENEQLTVQIRLNASTVLAETIAEAVATGDTTTLQCRTGVVHVSPADTLDVAVQSDGAAVGEQSTVNGDGTPFPFVVVEPVV